MAAKVEFSVAARDKSCVCLIIILLTLCLFPEHVECATAPPVTTQPQTTVAATTAIPTTQPPTTQVQTTTTTLPPTTTIAPDQARSSIPVRTDIGLCACDLTGNECDVNCCCDTECTDADKEPFVCSDVSVVIDNRLCYQQQVFPFINAPYANEVTDEGLFCIYFDNYADRNYYTDPDFVQDNTTFQNYVNSYAGPSFVAAETSTEPVFTFNSFYTSGDPVYVIYPSEARGYFSLPEPMLSSECADQNPVAYLEEKTSECFRRIIDLATECTGNAALNSSSYYEGFRVVVTPGLFGYLDNGTIPTTTAAPTTTPGATTAATTDANSVTTAAQTTTVQPTTTTPVPTLVDPNAIDSVYNNDYTLAVDTTGPHLCRQADGSLINCSLSQPSYAATTCSNAVVEMRYTITTNGTFGISSISLQFVFADITAADLPLLQTTSVTYRSLTDGNTVEERSGNPGYIIGKPVRYGELVINGSSQIINLNSDPSHWMTVVRARADGQCGSNATERKIVNFGENIRTGCVISLDTQNNNCEEIQFRIVQALEGYDHIPSVDTQRNVWIDNNRYVATFGNTDINKVGDWVKVIVSDRPAPPSNQPPTPSATCSLRMGMHIQFLYASVGALANPQSKILGVSLTYDVAQDVVIQCVGAFCQNGNTNTQNFEVSQSVSFVDVSQSAIKIQGEAPIFIARVPNDFFYPFLYYTNSASNCWELHNCLGILLSTILSVIMALVLGS